MKKRLVKRLTKHRVYTILKLRKGTKIMMGSLKDVAKLAGVSVSTVSYVINGKKTVRPETYKKIMDAIKEVDYHPNIAARSLKINKTKSIGIVVADFTNIFYIDVLTGIESELAKEGYSAIVSNSRNDPKIEALPSKMLYRFSIKFAVQILLLYLSSPIIAISYSFVKLNFSSGERLVGFPPQ